MSRNSQQRRTARKKKQQQRASGRQQGPGGQDNRQDRRNAQSDNINISELLRTGSVVAWGSRHDPRALKQVIGQLTSLERDGHSARVLNDAARVLDWVVDEVFLDGWQPGEFIHALRRELGKPETYLAFELVGCHSARTSARSKAPSDWIRQLDELQIEDGTPSIAGVVTTLRTGPKTDSTAFWTVFLTLAGCIRGLRSMTPLMAIPSEWDQPFARTSVPRTESKVLNTIRNLLAKAEATTYPAEAEALSAKAQDLMTRYAIDSAVLEAKRHISLTDEVQTRRLLIDNPYPEAKVSLLQSVSNVNGAQVIWHQDNGLVSIVGMPVDLDLCELFFTSLLVQSSRALTEAGHDKASRSPSFRRSFLLAYANRIGERLSEARARATAAASDKYGTALVPIMADRDEAVGAAFEEQFPSITSHTQSITNPRGWAAGRVAADDADITGSRDKIAR